MQKVTFDCEIITPMFMAGAKTSTPEIRPPSIKGMMRFWWRAVKGIENAEDLFNQEKDIFGSTEKKSPFLIRVVTSTQLSQDKFSPLPHKDGFRIPGYKLNQEISIILTGKDNITTYANILDVALLLGGFGKRSRRGFGSLVCKNREWNIVNRTQLINFILRKLNSITKDFEIQDGKIKRTSTPSANYPFIREVSSGNESNDVMKLLKKIGQATSIYNDPSLGYAGRYQNANVRMSSPVYVSVTKVRDRFVPVITTLHGEFPALYPERNFNKEKKFKERILQ
jgi:CRISPR-associated protein Cmr1